MNYVAKVDGMTCGGCANSVKTAFSNIVGITQVAIDLDEKEAHIEADKDITKEDLVKALEDTSYTIQSLSV